MFQRILIGVGVAAIVVAVAVLALRWLRPGHSNDRPAPDHGQSVAALSGIPPADDNWPRFRGPSGLGTSAHSKLPLQWGDEDNLLWKVALPGPGSSSPIVWGNRVFVTCYSDHEENLANLKRHLVCVDRGTGKIVWSQSLPAAQPEDRYSGYLTEHGYGTNTPATDGERVYAFFGKSGLFAFDFAGNQLWHRQVGRQSSSRQWGSAASVVLYADLVIVNASDEGRAVFAFHRENGEQKWKAEAQSLDLSFNTPILVARQDRAELLLAVPGQAWGLNPATGGLVWSVPIDLVNNISPSPVVHNDVLYLTGGLPTRTTAISLKGEQPQVLWSVGTGAYVPSPIYSNDRLFIVTDMGQALCLKAEDGETVSRRRLTTRGSGRLAYASPLLSAGKLYCVTRRGGTVVLKADDELEVLATNRFDSDDSDFNASPAVSGGQLFLRSDRFLYCIGTR